MQLAQFISTQDTIVDAMSATIGRARKHNYDVHEIEKELQFRQNHGCHLVMDESDEDLRRVLATKKIAVKSLLVQYAEQAHQLVDGMQEYESTSVIPQPLTEANV